MLAAGQQRGTQMADDPPREIAIFPDWSIPTIFSDGVGNFAPGEVAKFYLVRSDPAGNGVASSVTRPVAQVVMANPVFIQTAIFFELILGNLVKDGVVSQEQIDAVRKQYEQSPPTVVSPEQ
jgi:hypothetical protein